MNKRMTLREIQLAEYEILVALSDFLTKHNIRFYLYAGTLLGAVRHNGFIPWDDDIDIVIPREDYQKLRTLSCEELTEKNFKLFFPGESGYGFPFIKCCKLDTIISHQNIHNKRNTTGNHLFVDIFPLDNFYDNEIANRLLIGKVMFWRHVLDVACDQNHLSKSKFKTLIKKIIRIPILQISKQYTKEELCSKIDNFGVKMLRISSSKKIGNLVWGLGYKDHFDKSFFSETSLCEFEGEYFPIPQNYKDYLSHNYGDFMKLPDKKNRVWHEFLAYNTE